MENKTFDIEAKILRSYLQCELYNIGDGYVINTGYWEKPSPLTLQKHGFRNYRSYRSFRQVENY